MVYICVADRGRIDISAFRNDTKQSKGNVYPIADTYQGAAVGPVMSDAFCKSTHPAIHVASRIINEVNPVIDRPHAAERRV